MADPNNIKRKAENIAEHPANYLVEAVPGAGKTRLLIEVSKQIAGRKLIITLQKVFAKELNERLAKAGKQGSVSTTHALGLRLIKKAWRDLGFKAQPKVWSENNAKISFERYLERSSSGVPLSVAQWWGLYQDWSAQGDSFAHIAVASSLHLTRQQVARVQKFFDKWAKHKRKKERVDFQDMVRLPMQILDSPAVVKYLQRYEALLVDEVQDCSRAQLKLIVALMHRVPCSVVVGDPNQSIYGFAGAADDPFRFIRQSALSTKSTTLHHSIRLTQEVAEAAMAVMRANKVDVQMKTCKHGPQPQIIQYKDRIQQYDDVAAQIAQLIKAGVPVSEIAVVARTNSSLRPMSDALYSHAVNNTRIAQNKEAQSFKELLEGFKAFLRVVVTQTPDSIAVYLTHHTDLTEGVIRKLSQDAPERLTANYHIPKAAKPTANRCWKLLKDALGYTASSQLVRRYLTTFGGHSNLLRPNGFMRELRALGCDLRELEDPKVLLSWLEAPQQHDGVQLLTIHQAKGSEWDHVFCIDVYEGGLPHAKSQNSAEELRILFVALTRARYQLVITELTQERCHGKLQAKFDENLTVRAWDHRGERRKVFDEDLKLVKSTKKANRKPVRSTHRDQSRFLRATDKLYEYFNIKKQACSPLAG